MSQKKDEGRTKNVSCLLFLCRIKPINDRMMNAENVKNEFENGGWQKEAEQTMNDREKMDELKN